TAQKITGHCEMGQHVPTCGFQQNRLAEHCHGADEDSRIRIQIGSVSSELEVRHYEVERECLSDRANRITGHREAGIAERRLVVVMGGETGHSEIPWEVRYPHVPYTSIRGCRPIQRALLSDGVASRGSTERAKQHNEIGEKRSHRRISLPSAGGNYIRFVK